MKSADITEQNMRKPSVLLFQYNTELLKEWYGKRNCFPDDRISLHDEDVWLLALLVICNFH